MEPFKNFACGCINYLTSAWDIEFIITLNITINYLIMHLKNKTGFDENELNMICYLARLAKNDFY